MGRGGVFIMDPQETPRKWLFFKIRIDLNLFFARFIVKLSINLYPRAQNSAKSGVLRLYLTCKGINKQGSAFDVGYNSADSIGFLPETAYRRNELRVKIVRFTARSGWGPIIKIQFFVLIQFFSGQNQQAQSTFLLVCSRNHIKSY